MRLTSLINPFKVCRYLINQSKFRRVGSHPAFEGYIDCKHTRNIVAGDYCRFGKDVCLETLGEGRIVIGNNTELARHVLVSANTAVEIGNDCFVGEYTSIRDSDHGISRRVLIRKQEVVSKAIRIGNDVWIGRGCAILKGVCIGDGAVIGANSVVTHDLEPYNVVVGSPAKVIKKR